MAAACRHAYLAGTAAGRGRCITRMPYSFQTAGDTMPSLDDAAYYARLTKGALYLAEQAADPAESRRHLAMAARYRMQGAGQPWPPLRRVPA